MKEQDLDKLFRDKLADYSQVPPPEVMARMESRLQQRRKIAWIQFSRLAAALALIAIAVYLVVVWQDQGIEHDPTQVAIEQLPADTPLKEVELPKTIDIPPVAVADEPGSGNNRHLEPSEPVVTETTPGNPAESSETEEFHDPQPEINEPQLTEQVPADTEEAPKKTKVTITYKKSVSSTQPDLALNDEPSEKPKGLKKLWRKAQMVDYQSFSLAGIRATKDDLLAINRKEKDKSNKPD